ncbi:oxaloacetate decarboxylase [Stutzerimonas nosocomialis]|uniref:Probable oxaloacetate decarboxylase gamma chain n=1 Tax=Stutzerimonas nosocomialis TaxID=1056496 RepID=A0A5R9QCZ0_9GAMM|nr:OadG family transporter subunit [Stutzerimonas nosocomialis]TLX59554.1 oxaloacetate decarboxylase [Stutzerimonas nosocomialis]TLX60448.1 oxaloacetate decarboxylase [Stutzerimonas nosocomialis]TLX62997.1 oxaloacetate decarboxylase [Stutzerimonas nosocomialis]
MTSSQLLLEGVELMLFGMGFVFVFLLVLIASIRVMSYVIGHFAIAPAAQPAVAAPAPATEIDADTLAAIRGAIQQHRARRG